MSKHLPAGPALRRHHEHRWRALMPWADQLFGTTHCLRPRSMRPPRKNWTSLWLALTKVEYALN